MRFNIYPAKNARKSQVLRSDYVIKLYNEITTKPNLTILVSKYSLQREYSYSDA